MPASSRPIASPTESLPRGVVHVWHADLALASAYATNALGLLDREERERAARLRSDADRAQFVTAHGIMRILLARYLGCSAAAVRFGYGPHGKPYILRGKEQPDLHFNASRTSGLTMFAIAAERDVGIDAEKIDFDRGLTDSLSRALSDRERAFLGALPSEIEKYTECLKAWARKEAFLKARGDGLAIAPADVHTETISGKIYLSGRLQRRWRVYDIAVWEGYSAALAAEGETCQVVIREYRVEWGCHPPLALEIS